MQGAYTFPANPSGTSDDPIVGFAGGGILLSDGYKGNCKSNSIYCCYVIANNNQVISTTNYGIAISSGHNNTITGNVVVGSGKLPNQNDFIKAQIKVFENSCSSNMAGCFQVSDLKGIYSIAFPPTGNGNCEELGQNINYFQDYICSTGENIFFTENIVKDNLVKWTAYWGKDINNNYIIAPKISARIPCNEVNNSSYYQIVCGDYGNVCSEGTYQDEMGEYENWLKKLNDNNIKVGVIPNGSNVLTLQVPVGTHQNQTYSAYNQVYAIGETTLLPGSTLQLSDFSFVVCATNNNPILPSARIGTKDEPVIIENNTTIGIQTTNGYEIYPNPASGDVYIKSSNNDVQKLKINITNSFGIRVFSNFISQNSDDNFYFTLKGYPDGVYFVQIVDSNTRANYKLVLQK